MKCHKCNSTDTKVIESREVADGESTRRRRKCPICDSRFTTYERRERPKLIVVKSDNSRELFNRSKLMSGIQISCEKTTVSGVQIEKIVADIETRLYDLGESEISSTQIGDLVMDELANASDVAYVRFASVYRRFTDITGFEAELAQIRDRRASEA